MKEIKNFIQELCDCAKPSANGRVVTLEDATRIVAHAFAAGMNFQDHEIKRKHKFRHFEKEDIDEVADFKFIPNPANGGDDDYIIADMVFKEYTYGESGEEPFCDVNALNRDFGGPWFHNNNGGWDGIVHNPDCKCNKKIKSTTQY